MGDPKKNRKKYSTPNHPWQKARIDSEAEIIRAYGLKNKKEVWRALSRLRNFREQAKRLSSLRTDQDAVETQQVLARMRRYGLLKEDARLDDALTLSINDILDRRLQTIVYRKGLAKSMKQSRQFITHEHITINGIKIKSPGHLVTLSEQGTIEFRPKSTLSDPEHPERAREKIIEVEEAADVESKMEGPVPEADGEDSETSEENLETEEAAESAKENVAETESQDEEKEAQA